VCSEFLFFVKAASTGPQPEKDMSSPDGQVSEMVEAVDNSRSAVGPGMARGSSIEFNPQLPVRATVVT
jgi:hypothetical protein